MLKSVFVTGASSGIGYATAAEFTRYDYRVFAGVRNRVDAERLRHALGPTVTPIMLDVTDAAAIHAAAELVAATVGDQGLAGLVNNAGIAVAGPLMHLPLDELRHQYEVNVVGVVGVTQAMLPLLGARRPCPHPPGRIVNISSVSGRIAYPFLGPYAASKHALEAISDSLRRELMYYGIDVIVVQPGAVRTAIWGKIEDADVDRFAQTDYHPFLVRMQRKTIAQGRNGLPAARVAAIVRQALTQPRPRTRYPLPNQSLTGWLLPQWLPGRWVDWLIARWLGFDSR